VADEKTLAALAVPPAEWGRRETIDQSEKQIRERMAKVMKETQEMIIRNLREHAKDPDAQ